MESEIFSCLVSEECFMENFKRVNSENFMINPFRRIGRDWMLVTAGDRENGVNTLTACWGGLGDLWHKDAAFIFIRPSRYTYEFIEKQESFTLSFFDKEYKKALAYLGSHSGRDEDKIGKVGLHVKYFDNMPGFDEADLVITCKKMYYLDFISKRIPGSEIKRFYSKEDEGDFHRLYAGEVIGIYEK